MSRYVVIDLEMCNVPKEYRKGTYRRASEIIQIGAVLLDENLEIEASFMTYVSPEYGFVDDFIKNLTGITQKDVQGAPNLQEALQAFVAWLPVGVTVVSWSMTDAIQIQRETEAKSISIDGLEEILGNWVDSQKMFTEKMHSTRCYKLSEALVAADIIYEDGAHDGLVDAHNTALLFAKMLREPELVLNTYYKKAITGEESSSGFCLGSLFAGLDLSGLAVA